MKRILAIMTGLMLVVGVAGNAAASFSMGQFALVTGGNTIETADSFGGNSDGTYIGTIDDLAGTTLTDIWNISSFGGDTYADLAIMAVGTPFYDADYTQEISYIGIQSGLTPTFRNSGYTQWSSTVNGAAATHGQTDFAAYATYMNSTFNVPMPPTTLGGFVTSSNAGYVSIADILTQDYYMDIWAYDSYSQTSWDTGYDVRVYYADGTINAQITPIPGALVLLASGLLGLVGIRRKRA